MYDRANIRNKNDINTNLTKKLTISGDPDVSTKHNLKNVLWFSVC